jgi:drug/metabolite transporter superfamily protein YnfA
MYAAELKRNLQLTQSQLDTLSSAIFCAGVFSWIPGLIVDRFGTRVGTVSGGILGTVSLCCYWAVATKFFPVERSLIVPTLCLLGVLIFLSCALIVSSYSSRKFPFPIPGGLKNINGVTVQFTRLEVSSKSLSVPVGQEAREVLLVLLRVMSVR